MGREPFPNWGRQRAGESWGASVGVMSQREGTTTADQPGGGPHPASIEQSAAVGRWAATVGFIRISACVTQERQEGKGGRQFNELSHVLLGFSRCQCRVFIIGTSDGSAVIEARIGFLRGRMNPTNKVDERTGPAAP